MKVRKFIKSRHRHIRNHINLGERLLFVCAAEVHERFRSDSKAANDNGASEAHYYGPCLARKTLFVRQNV